MALIFCWVSASLASLSQSRRGGNAVRPARITRRAPWSANQPAVSRPSAPRPPVIRYAASGRHRSGSCTGSPDTGARAGVRNSPSRSARIDFAGLRRTVDSAGTRPAMSAPSGRSTRPPHNCGCSARMTPAVPHIGLWATAASELPSRTPRVMIHSVTGWLSSRSASFPTRSTSSIDMRTAPSTSASPERDSAI